MGKGFNLFMKSRVKSSREQDCDVRRRIVSRLLDENPVCCKCGLVLSAETATLEHKIPRIIMAAKYIGYSGTRIHHYDISCRECNNHDHITSAVGGVFNGARVEEILRNARYLCNLVRPIKKSMSKLPNIKKTDRTHLFGIKINMKISDNDRNSKTLPSLEFSNS